MGAISLLLNDSVFIAHGLVVVAVLYLVWSGRAQPRPGSVWRAMVGLNLFAALAGSFNLLFGTNYMYLQAKPQNPSALDLLGPWPWHLAYARCLRSLSLCSCICRSEDRIISRDR